MLAPSSQSISLYAFCLDYELEVESDWLKDGMDWEREQNRDIEREQEAEGMPTGERRARQALIEGKRVRERKKHQLLNQLGEI